MALMSSLQEVFTGNVRFTGPICNKIKDSLSHVYYLKKENKFCEDIQFTILVTKYSKGHAVSQVGYWRGLAFIYYFYFFYLL